VDKGKAAAARLSVFKGREAKLNKAIFHILALKGPQTIYDMHKQIETYRGLRHTRYASVNKRVRFLEESGYVSRIGLKKTKAGFEASIYELHSRGYLALALSFINLDELVGQADETTALGILGGLMLAIQAKAL